MHFLQILLTEISSKMAMIFFYHQNSILYEFLKYRTTLKPRSRYNVAATALMLPMFRPHRMFESCRRRC